VSFDDMRNPVQNIYIKKVEKKKLFGYDKDELWNTVIKTYPNVGQFWTYGKDAFLKQPVYSRDFPPCKYCQQADRRTAPRGRATTRGDRTMTITLLRRLGPLLIGSVAAFGLTATSNAAEELRIGYVAPTTGIFAQVGKDMVDGFQLYLDDVKSDFGGAKVKFIVEDEQAKPDTAVTRAKKLTLQDHVHLLVGGLLASSGYALAPVSTAEKTVYVVPVSAADDLTQRDLSKYP